MNLPFTEDQFLQTFERYNHAIWPAQVLAVILCLGLLVATLSRLGAKASPVLLTLAALWLWNGIFYHWLFFSSINPAAWIFGGLFVFQGLLFGWIARHAVGEFRAAWDWKSFLGLLIACYAIGIYPLIGWFSGHAYPYAPVLGVAPCPTTIFTFGLMLMARPVLSRWLFVVPLIWAIIGTSAAFALGVREDLGLGVAGVLALIVLIPSPRLISHKPRTPRLAG